MAKRKFTLMPEELRKLRVIFETTKDSALRMRAQSVWMYAQNYPVAEILNLQGCSRTSLMNWVRGVQTEGLNSLEDRRRGGNNAKLTEAQRTELADLMKTYTPEQLLGPMDTPLAGAYWSVPTVRALVETRFGVTYQSPTTYRQLLKESGFSYQKPAKQYKSRRPMAVVAFQEQLEKN